jgi:hypothetical protein
VTGLLPQGYPPKGFNQKRRRRLQMAQHQCDIKTLRDEIINSFRPIEQLFKIMNASSLDDQGELVRSCSEVGLELSQNFRTKINAILDDMKNGSTNGQ